MHKIRPVVIKLALSVYCTQVAAELSFLVFLKQSKALSCVLVCLLFYLFTCRTLPKDVGIESIANQIRDNKIGGIFFLHGNNVNITSRL